ncbi:Nudix family hydrolase [Methylocaldum gracile]|uniref:Nudix family hydrolase n=1 Tax=unclassified Methylocaldum TaxID=2622260 RepID=UPI0010620C22
MSGCSELHVAAGVIRNGLGQILIARRLAHVHQGDLWEFPGGKLEAGETAKEALSREIREELNLEVIEASPLIRIRHAYPERCVLLDVWRVDRFEGTPIGMQGQPIRWVSPDELPGFAFPAANRPIVTAARLPDQYAILDDESGDEALLRERLHHLVSRRVGLIQLRARRLGVHQYEALAHYAVEYCRERGAILLLNADPCWVVGTSAAGLHLTAQRLMSLSERPLEKARWVAASCHNLGELKHAERIGVDLAVLAPVLSTPTHPHAVPLGWITFAELVDQVNIPVFALGGVSPADVDVAKSHGAQGVAGIRGFLP